MKSSTSPKRVVGLSFTVLCGVCGFLVPNQVFAQNTAIAKGTPVVNGVKLGYPGVKIVAHGLPDENGPINMRTLLTNGMGFFERYLAQPMPTEEGWTAAEQVGFARQSVANVRVFIDATEEDQKAAANADIGFAFVRRGNLYDVEGHINLMNLAENGQFPRSLAKMILDQPEIADAEKAQVRRLYTQSMRVALKAQQGLAAANAAVNPGGTTQVTAAVEFDSMGVDVTVGVEGLFGNLFKKIKGTIGCVIEAFAGLGGENELEVHCDLDPPNCGFSMKKSGVSDEALSQFVTNFLKCF